MHWIAPDPPSAVLSEACRTPLLKFSAETTVQPDGVAQEMAGLEFDELPTVPDAVTVQPESRSLEEGLATVSAEDNVAERPFVFATVTS